MDRKAVIGSIVPVAALVLSAAAGASAASSTAPPGLSALYPLTGLPVDASSYEARPALAVVVHNGDNSRPQGGLQDADLVFEVLAEGTTRFVAVFNSRDASDSVGPIRSARSTDVDLLAGLGVPILATSGWNQGVGEELESSGFVVLDQREGMFRLPGRGGAPYDLFADTVELFAVGAGAGEATSIFSYGEAAAATPAGSFELTLAGIDVRWDYEPGIGRYVRSQSGWESPLEPHVLVDDSQVSATNVVVLDVPYFPSASDAGSPQADTVGEGGASIYRGGTVTHGFWARDERTDPFTLTDADGEPVSLAPGTTWVELVEAT